MSKDEAELSMYKDICKDKFSGLSKDIQDVKKIALSTHKAICVSNGTKSILSRLDKIEDTGTKSKFGIDLKPIESRDIPRIIGAIGITALVLERFGALKPILEFIGK